MMLIKVNSIMVMALPKIKSRSSPCPGCVMGISDEQISLI